MVAKLVMIIGDKWTSLNTNSIHGRLWSQIIYFCYEEFALLCFYNMRRPAAKRNFKFFTGFSARFLESEKNSKDKLLCWPFSEPVGLFCVDIKPGNETINLRLCVWWLTFWVSPGMNNIFSLELTGNYKIMVAPMLKTYNMCDGWSRRRVGSTCITPTCEINSRWQWPSTTTNHKINPSIPLKPERNKPGRLVA